MRDAPTFAENDVCRVRNVRGLWRITRFNLVAGEVELSGGVYGRHGKARTRTTTVDQLLPVEDTA